MPLTCRRRCQKNHVKMNIFRCKKNQKDYEIMEVNLFSKKTQHSPVKSTSFRNGNFVSRIFCRVDTADEMARWYSRLPKFVCGTIKPILKCCGVFSSFFVWCSNLWRSLSPPIRFGPRSPIWMPDDSDDVFDRHAKVVVAIIDTKTNKMCDVFIITPSQRDLCNKQAFFTLT